ncbi:chaperone DnaJ-domain superfamily protein [Actinidia rufa]|uniref:Chaperone DnaJ-domain superfamily protein n=1 Tax=Actinidia rufa TaxID=165716 RepID=A0A7J0FSY0_9ERIC|nr:chaperone DnaJ-domain superfamily protein [Actinidia rufa]
MDDFGALARDFGFRPQGKSAPMAQPKSSFGARLDGVDRSSSSSRDGFLFNDVFGGPPKHTSAGNSKSASSMSDFEYDSIFKSSAAAAAARDSKNRSSSPVYDKPVYDEDIFDGLPGLTSKSKSSSVRFDNDVFESISSNPKQNRNQSQSGSVFDDFLGNLGMNEKSEPKKDTSSRGLDDLIPGFGGRSPQSSSSISELTLVEFPEAELQDQRARLNNVQSLETACQLPPSSVFNFLSFPQSHNWRRLWQIAFVVLMASRNNNGGRGNRKAQGAVVVPSVQSAGQSLPDGSKDCRDAALRCMKAEMEEMRQVLMALRCIKANNLKMPAHMVAKVSSKVRAVKLEASHWGGSKDKLDNDVKQAERAVGMSSREEGSFKQRKKSAEERQGQDTLRFPRFLRNHLKLINPRPGGCTSQAKNNLGAGAGVVLKSPEGATFEYCFRLNFSAMNNEAKYAAFIVGLRSAKKLLVPKFHIFSDSKLVVNREFRAVKIDQVEREHGRIIAMDLVSVPNFTLSRAWTSAAVGLSLHSKYNRQLYAITQSRAVPRTDPGCLAGLAEQHPVTGNYLSATTIVYVQFALIPTTPQ